MLHRASELRVDDLLQLNSINEVVEVLAGIPDGEPVAVLMVEGEPNVELGRFHGIAGLTLQGSNWNDAEITRVC